MSHEPAGISSCSLLAIEARITSSMPQRGYFSRWRLHTMDAKQLEGRVRLITEGGVPITLRRATMTDGVTSEIDAFVPLSAVMSLDLSGKLMVRADWVAENLGPGILGPQATLDPPKSAAVALDKSPAFRRLMMKYHPDTARGGLFTASEIAADLNALADSLKYDRKGE